MNFKEKHEGNIKFKSGKSMRIVMKENLAYKTGHEDSHERKSRL